MRFRALATDYDGTLAQGGRVDVPTLAALRRARDAGRRLILVSGRELPELRAFFSDLDLFDLAVLENGALLYDPRVDAIRVLAEPPPPRFAAELIARGAQPVATGRVIVATDSGHQDLVREVIREFAYPLDAILNKDSVMVLPAGVDKASGLTAALGELQLDARHVVGVGDAENDHVFLRMCGCGAAVANALPDLKAVADLVLSNAYGAGVAELIDRMLADDIEERRR